MMLHKRPGIRIILPLALAAGLYLGTAAPAWAQEPPCTPAPVTIEAGKTPGDRKGVVGEVTCNDGTRAEIRRANGSVVSIDVTNPDLIVVKPPVRTFTKVDIMVGDRVGVLAEVQGDLSLLALRVMIKPHQSHHSHLTGPVVTKTETTITIIDGTGREHVVNRGGNVLLPVAEGEVATLAVKRGKGRGKGGEETTTGEGTDGDGEELTATGAVTAEQIGQRISKHAKSLGDLADAGLISGDRAAARIDALNAKLARIAEHQEAKLTKLLDKVKKRQTRDAITLAKAKAGGNFKAAKAEVERQRGKAKGAGKGKGKPQAASEPPDGADGDGGGTVAQGGGKGKAKPKPKDNGEAETNEAPEAADQNLTTTVNNPLDVALTGGDAETCELTFAIVAGPSNGTLSDIADADCTAGTPNADSATVTYTPNTDFTGEDSFTFTVSDGAAESKPATIEITVGG